MKKSYYRFSAIVVLITLMSMLVPCSHVLAGPDDEVTINDPVLRLAIASEIGSPPFTESELSSIIDLDASFLGISDLTGLEYCTNLKYLYLGINNISDISALAGLTNLKELGLSGNDISDISALAGLTNLQGLDLYGNGISDITALSELTNLVYLDLYGNNISDITALSELTYLMYLYLSDNNISDISDLSGLTNLQELSLGGNGISDITALSGLIYLMYLDLGDNDISDISALSGLTRLRSLYLGSNNISDIKPLVDNTGLGIGDFVDLLNNPLDDFSILNYIPELQDRWIILYYDNPMTNHPPDADAGGPYEVDEGVTFTLDGSGSSDPDDNIDLYEWDLDNDGQYDVTGVTANATFNDNGSFIVELLVTDKYEASDNDTAVVTVNNVAPTADAGDPKTANEGETVAFTGSFTDPGTADTHTFTWDFGDGSPSISGTLTPSHVYADDGAYTATLQVTDDDGGTGTNDVSVTIGNLPPVVATLPGQTINFGDLVTVNATFTDPGMLDTHTANISWGDGSIDPQTVDESSGTFTGSHVYAWPDIYEVTVTVTDNDLGEGSCVFSVEVLPVPGVMVETMSDIVKDIELPGGKIDSITVSLDKAMEALEDSNPKNDVAAIKTLKAFINKIEALRGKTMSEADADALIAKALETILSLGGEE